MVQSVAYERGFHVRGSPLWFDAERRRELCVLTGLERRLPAVHRRAVASAAMAATLERAGYGGGILPAPWGRWVGLGGHRIQLIDAQASPGAAIAVVEHDGDELLVAGLLRARAVAWPRARHLVARLPTLGHVGQPLRDVALMASERLDDLAQAGQRGRVWVDSLEVGLALLDECSVLGRPLQPRGSLQKLVAGGDAPSPRSKLPSLALATPDTCWSRDGIVIDSGLGPWHPSWNAAPQPPVRLRWFGDTSVLAAAAADSRARQVTLVGVPPAWELAVRKALGRHVTVRFLSEAHQMVLPSQPLI